MLYIVATPIGNLKDISIRALEVLNNVEYIACEDTRTSLTFLSAHNINKKLISYHKFNESQKSNLIIEDLKKGKDIALISDAGMPGISDPGNILVKKLKEENLPYTVIPGASALINAFVLSGYDAPFTFVGFLPEKNKDKKELLNNLKDLPYPTIFYVSPHSLNDFFENLLNVFGDREVCVVREITKMFEEVNFTTLTTGYTGTVKGEFVCIVKGAQKLDKVTDETIIEEFKKLINSGMTKKSAIQEVVKKYDLKKNYVYNLTCNL